MILCTIFYQEFSLNLVSMYIFDQVNVHVVASHLEHIPYFRENYSFLNLALCTVTKGPETIRGNTVLVVHHVKKYSSDSNAHYAGAKTFLII